MRDRGMKKPGPMRRAAFSAAALCSMCVALLTCTPPNFDDDPVVTGDPLNILPLKPQIAAGSEITFAGSGGTTPYEFSIVAGSGQINASTGLYKAPSTPAEVTIRVTDGPPTREHVDTIVKVIAGPLALSPTNITSLQTNEHAFFQASGGETPYVYSIVTGVGVINSASGEYYSPNTGTGIAVKVTEKNGTGNERTATIGAVVDPPTPPVTISPSTLTATKGTVYEFAIAGGKPSYSFQVTQGTASPMSGTSNPFTVAFTTVGTVKITASDSSSTPKTDIATITVIPPPLVIAPDTLTINVNSTWTFSSDGGTIGYNYSILPPSYGTVDGNKVTFTTVGPCTVRVTDAASKTADCIVTVNTAPAALNINPPAIALTRGGTQLFMASGGSGSGYSFSRQSGVGTMDAGGLYHATTEGIAQIKLVDNDDHEAYADITVNPPSLALDATSVTIEAGDSHQFIASGGTPTYTYSPISGVGSITSGGLFTSVDPGTATIKVTDSSTYPLGGLSITATIIVNPAPLTISPTNPSMMSGSTITFAAAGGTEGTGYTFSKVSGVGSINALTGAYTSSTVGIAVVRVTDSTTPTHLTAETTITVTAPPLQITPTAVNLSYNSGQDFNATGGVTPYTFEIVSGGGSINAATGVFTAPSTDGTTVVQVKDSSTPTKLTSQAAINVYAPLALSPRTPTVDAGSTQPFTATGGVPFPGSKYSFSISGDGSIIPPSGTSTSITFTAPASSGIAVIRVTDSIGNIDQTTVTVLDPATWGAKQTIDGPKWSGQYASLALDSSGNAQIAYWEAKDKRLKLAKQTGPTTWNLSTIDSNNDGDQYASLALYSGNACVAWYDAHSHRLKYALWYNNNWLTWSVDSDGDVGKYASLTLDSSTGYPRIAYYDATHTNLKYAAWNGSDWDVTTVVDSTDDVGKYASLALDSSGNPRIAYYDAANGLRYIEYNGSSWGTAQFVDSGNVGHYASLKLNASGHPCIAYYDAANTNLKYAEWSGSWSTTTVDMTGDVGKFASLALNPSGDPRVAYYDASTTNGNLKYASRTGSVWVVGTIDSSTNNAGQNASIALDPTTPYRMRIAYWDSNAKDLLFIQEIP